MNGPVMIVKGLPFAEHVKGREYGWINHGRNFQNKRPPRMREDW